jgi:lactoylglutathione lyase
MMEIGKDSLDLGIVVGDIKASLSFYVDMLGLKFIEQVPVWFGTMHRLRFGSSDFKLIDPKVKPPRGAIGLDAQIGFRYVTFVIKNLSQVCEDLRSRGIPFEIPEKQLRPGTRLAMVRDPDGNIVEFVERS